MSHKHYFGPVDPRRILIFRTVARAGSISAGARELGWTQPAVSQHLRALERAAGSPLLLRGAGGVSLTEAGRALLRHADSLASVLHVAGSELDDLAQVRRGTVRLACYPSGAATRVPVALSALRARHPGIDVHLIEAEPPEALAMVHDGSVDLALVFAHQGRDLADADLVTHPLGIDDLLLVLPDGHRRARTRGLALERLADETWIAGCERCRAYLLQACREAGFEPLVRHETDDYVVVQNLVAHGLGIALLPDTSLQAFRHTEVAVRRVRGVEPRRLGAVHRPGVEAIPAVAAVLRALVDDGVDHPRSG
jgi:molybdate transport repressor ModE-like protein